MIHHCYFIQKFTPKGLLTIGLTSFVFLIISSLLFVPPLLAADASSTHETLQKTIKSQQKKISRIKKGISSQQDNLRKNKEQELVLYNELKEIDKKLLAKQKALLTSQERLMKQEGFLETKEIELDLISEDKLRVEVHIKNRLRAFYQMGDIGVINTVFSASTLPELLNTKEYFHHLFQYDRLAIKQYKDKLALLDGARQEMLAGKEELLAIIVERKEQEKALISFRQERFDLLKHIQTKESLYKQALAEMNKSAAHLSETFKQYKKRLISSAKKKKQISARLASHRNKRKISANFPSRKGKLPPPVANGTLVTPFGKYKGVFGVEIESNGIDIEVRDDARVKAVYKGITVFAGELPGYGNVVIIDHGLQYFTLVSRMNTIRTKKGNRVKQGETIGRIEKENSGLLKKGLHFEVRSGSTPVDPLLWLDKSQLTINARQQ